MKIFELKQNINFKNQVENAYQNLIKDENLTGSYLSKDEFLLSLIKDLILTNISLIELNQHIGKIYTLINDLEDPECLFNIYKEIISKYAVDTNSDRYGNRDNKRKDQIRYWDPFFNSFRNLINHKLGVPPYYMALENKRKLFIYFPIYHNLFREVIQFKNYMESEYVVEKQNYKPSSYLDLNEILIDIKELLYNV